MLAAFSAQQGGVNERPPSFLLRCFFEPFFFRILGPWADGVPHFWPPSPMGYPIFGRFLYPIWGQLGAILGHFGARAGPEWAGGVTRSARNCICCSWAVPQPPWTAPAIPWIGKNNFEKVCTEMQQSHGFARSDHVRHEFGYGIYLEF